MNKILISACLLGHPVRYDGRSMQLANTQIKSWQDEGRVVAFCPEIAAGFPTPRAPAEIETGRSGRDVWARHARIKDHNGVDVTDDFLVGARLTCELVTAEQIRHALLTDGSPSCGSRHIYSGNHDGSRRIGEGVVSAALREIDVQVFTQLEIAALAARLAE